MTQLTLVLYVGGSLDLLAGFNQTAEGLHTLLLLFVLAPLANLAWLIIEIKLSFPRARAGKTASAILLPLIPLVFLTESLAIDLYILSQVRM